jgi:hypothetical protein
MDEATWRKAMRHPKIEDITTDYIRGWIDAHDERVAMIQFMGYTENDGLPDGGVRFTGPVLVSPEFALDHAADLPEFLNDRFNEAMRRRFDDFEDYPVIGIMLSAIGLDELALLVA